jgi:hypothetical protein
MLAQSLKEIFSRPAIGLLTCQLCDYAAPRFDPLDPGFQRIALEQGFPYSAVPARRARIMERSSFGS